jgi:hypothetical protein
MASLIRHGIVKDREEIWITSKETSISLNNSLLMIVVNSCTDSLKRFSLSGAGELRGTGGLFWQK